MGFLKFCRIYPIVFLLIIFTDMKAQVNNKDNLMIGAEIFIEPGQSDYNVEGWFNTLLENNMEITRIRMFENYMKNEHGGWDFRLFDRAFSYAEKYHIKVYANLFPATDFTDVGGFKFPADEEHLNRIADYVKNVVIHFKEFSSLYGWVPINEPGGGNMNDPLAQKLYNTWLKEQNAKIEKDKLTDYHHPSFDHEKFLRYYNTWYLKWLTDEIRKYDSVNPVHVNNHAIFNLASQYDFPAWRTFLSSLGGSAHASWHFGFFTRRKYALAMSANSEILRSGAGNIPWFMTELQGGNNIYSGIEPMCPTKEEIGQWLWITIGAGSKGAIYWCLNPRASGSEAGEWAMVDFQNRPTDRLMEAGRIGTVLKEHQQLFSVAKPLNSKIHVVHVKESMWVENRLARDSSKDEIRLPGAVMKSALSYFEAFSYMGLQPSLEELGEFDFYHSSYQGHTMVLSHQIAIPVKYHDKLRYFVRKGGRLMIDGLTGYYDENAICIMINDFPLKDLFGGSVSEFKYMGNLFSLQIDGENLPTYALKGSIHPQSDSHNQVQKIICSDDHKIYGLINDYGEGNVVWIPSPIGLGARIADNYKPFIEFLQRHIDLSDAIRFEPFLDNVMMKTLKSGDEYITIVINKSDSEKTVKIMAPFELRNPVILFFNGNAFIKNNLLEIGSEEIAVIHWNTH